jgi:multimeric flavodoxin WrbA
METVKLLGICGSPRKNGNSRYLLERALEAATEWGPESVNAEMYSVGGKEIAPCIGCYRCKRVGDCATQDDFQELRDKWAAADAIIYSLPVYHIGIPGNLKCFIDRLGNSLYSYYGGVISKELKTVGVVVQGSHMFAGQEEAMTSLINHALVMRCVPVPGDPWQSWIGAAGWTRSNSRKDALRRLYAQGEADARIAVSAAESVGRRVVEMALVIKSGGVVCADILTRDGTYAPFLSRLCCADEVG